MGMDEAKEFWAIFDGMTKTAQADYLNSRFGEMLWDISRNWDDEVMKDSIKELNDLKLKELNSNGAIAEDNIAILNTEHFAVEVKEDNEQLGVIIDIFHRHGDLIDTYTYWNEDVIDRKREEQEDKDSQKFRDEVIAHLNKKSSGKEYNDFKHWLEKKGLDIEFILFEDEAIKFEPLWLMFKEQNKKKIVIDEIDGFYYVIFTDNKGVSRLAKTKNYDVAERKKAKFERYLAEGRLLKEEKSVWK